MCSYDCSMLNAVNLVCSLGLSECNPLKCNESCLKEDSVVLFLFRPTSVCSLSLSFSICSRSCVHWIYKYVLTKSGLNEWYIFQTICSYISKKRWYKTRYYIVNLGTGFKYYQYVHLLHCLDYFQSYCFGKSLKDILITTRPSAYASKAETKPQHQQQKGFYWKDRNSYFMKHLPANKHKDSQKYHYQFIPQQTSTNKQQQRNT